MGIASYVQLFTLTRAALIQHLKFARECTKQFNPQKCPREAPNGSMCVDLTSSTYNTVINSLLAAAKRVMSLKAPHLQVSRSHQDPRSHIHINDGAQVIEDKIGCVLTDLINGVSYGPANCLGVSNLLEILSYFDHQRRTAEELARSYHASDDAGIQAWGNKDQLGGSGKYSR